MATPRRLPASYPETPSSSLRDNLPDREFLPSKNPFPKSPTKLVSAKSPLRSQKKPSTADIDSNAPYVSTNIIDAPTQRLYTVAVFGLLQAYKFYDLGRLYSAEDDSISELWFMLKWVAVDGVFLRLLPLLRVPWFTFSPSATVLQIVLMSAINIFLCLRYQNTFILLLLSIWKNLYNRELGLSDRRVKVRDIVLNGSHILGKHTLHYLPEGLSAQLNPANIHLCIDLSSKDSTILPISINSSTPTYIQMSRIDFTTSERSTINITQKEIKRLMKLSNGKSSDTQPKLLHYPIRLAGLYRLEKVVDISKLVVRVQRAEALIVECPTASFVNDKRSMVDRCKGDLSDIALDVSGVPPLQLKYSRSIDKHGKDVTIQSISPEGYDSPLLRTPSMMQNEPKDTLSSKLMSWASTQRITIALNESLASQGPWTYAIEEITDGMGNLVKFSKNGPGSESRFHRHFQVHERPTAKYSTCNSQSPLMVARGRSGTLPVDIAGDREGAPYEIEYGFNSQGSGAISSDRIGDDEVRKTTLKSSGQPILVKEPGLYTLKSVSSRYCTGEVLEPSACLFLTPPDPSLSIDYDEIVDSCAGSSIGLTIDMTLVGTPPFKVHYKTIKDKRDISSHVIPVSGTRYQLRLTPSAAGHYTYEFFGIEDQVYDNISLDAKILRAEQRVIPMAGASFIGESSSRQCIGESAAFTVEMQGSGPWSLEYELVFAGKRTKYKDEGITTNHHLIKTPKLSSGGEYALVLTTIEDSHGCKNTLNKEAFIEVHRQRPTASFAGIDGSMVAETLEGQPVSIPLRLIGEKPFRVKYRHFESKDHSTVQELTAPDFNSFLRVNKEGSYEIIAVSDAICPGIVSDKANTFEVNWIARPSASFHETSSLSRRDTVYLRNPVCEGDEDAIELNLQGKPPFVTTFEQSYSGDKNDRKSLKNIDLKSATNRALLRMETSRSGTYRYRLKHFSDSIYVTPTTPQVEIVLEQNVHARPSAKFRSPGKVYKYCLEAGTGDDTIPILLEGIPPFTLSIGVKHYSTGKLETINIPNIDTNQYLFRVPSHVLTLGGHIVSITKLRDARGCSRKFTADLPHVNVAVADLPSLTSLDSKPYYCVGDRISYSLAGAPPFLIEYTFGGRLEKATTTSNFQRIAEKPGVLTIKSIKDAASECKVDLEVVKNVYAIPSVRVSEGSQVVEGIHEGERVEIHFQLHGTPPFTFTYIRSEISKKGAKAKILEMHTQTTEAYTHTISASLEGTYEVVSIHDKYCGYSAPKTREYNPKQLEYF